MEKERADYLLAQLEKVRRRKQAIEQEAAALLNQLVGMEKVILAELSGDELVLPGER